MFSFCLFLLSMGMFCFPVLLGSAAQNHNIGLTGGLVTYWGRLSVPSIPGASGLTLMWTMPHAYLPDLPSQARAGALGLSLRRQSCYVGRSV